MSNNLPLPALRPSDHAAALLAADRTRGADFLRLVRAACGDHDQPAPLFAQGVIAAPTFPGLLLPDERVELLVQYDDFAIETGMLLMGAYPASTGGRDETGVVFGPIHAVPPIDGDEDVPWDLFDADERMLEASEILFVGPVVAIRGQEGGDSAEWWGIISPAGIVIGLNREGGRTVALGSRERWHRGRPTWMKEAA